jgi:hypothetical protein
MRPAFASARYYLAVLMNLQDNIFRGMIFREERALDRKDGGATCLAVKEN